MIRCPHCQEVIQEPHTLPIEEHFWSLVDKTSDCWLWVGGLATNGYGRFRRGGQYAHRYSYELCNGSIPENMMICHSCDNPQCVNPAHLFVGTGGDNVRDKVTKGRQARGESMGGAKLDEEKVREIRASDLSPKELSDFYHVAKSTICLVKQRKIWSHVVSTEKDIPVRPKYERLRIFTREQTEMIRAEYTTNNTSYRKLAVKYNVSATAIRNAVLRKDND